ncbi:bifunctional riboflavin kinase/FAD synthetase [Flavobacterium sp. SUN046]|uniref:bifunctional riboflavin kinase/FAD synthetase n=1 Tax=Flavobacterium sp. SUN046 TaxID=3002440 RepID=UPI002DBDC7A7|nr:bifunctional riboflavin kinase/FAD synthetase [Flavobacterium sp. SUN046]MEC4051041.1 bifunctional riboflavin kinase/FAD synthetase [Flavobacterium sp. SUN046]
MKICPSIEEFHSSNKTIVTIGIFDGVHKGHKRILERLTHSAKDLGCESLVLTFFPHPRMVLQDPSAVQLINTIKEKEVLLANSGIDHLVIHPFTLEFAKLSAETFVKEVLVDHFNVQKIIIGYDHRFGNNRTATIDDLIVFGKQYGFEVEQISAEEIDDIAVSSTKIRKAVLEGNIALANNYLGYSYLLTGTVVQGKQLGRTIGFPTANLNIPEAYKLIPNNGVYIVQSLLDGNKVYGIMNIGTRPTVDGTTRSIEVHYLNYSEDLYGKTIGIELLEHIRDEQKFDSLDLLKQQIQKDKETALEYIHKTSF